MAKSLPSCVADASVLIDLYHGCVLKVALRQFRFLVPDVIVVEELISPRGEDLVRWGCIQKVPFSAQEVQEVFVLRRRYPGPSTPDLFALLLAQSRNLILLTGDGHLRRAASQEGVEVHGVLWVLDRLVETQALSPTRAILALQRMLSLGARLPQQACRERFVRWMRP